MIFIDGGAFPGAAIFVSRHTGFSASGFLGIREGAIAVPRGAKMTRAGRRRVDRRRIELKATDHLERWVSGSGSLKRP
ncbi:MAG: hypothetical protein CMJ54_00425 [Planctomycetaceae bacterium]|nr:hypothetical protein [Planctomycetaceae bacterium]